MQKLDDEAAREHEASTSKKKGEDDSDAESVASIDDENDAEAGTIGAKAHRRHAEVCYLKLP